jgi:hypothetical protein
MPISLKSFKKAVGYVRISSELQNDSPDPLLGQSDRVRQACARYNWSLSGIYGEQASAVGDHSLSKRPELTDALTTARRENAVLVVTDATRLFRDTDAGLKAIKAFKVPIYSVRDDKLLTQKELARCFREGRVIADKSRAGTSKAMRAKAGPAPRPHLKDAAAKSRRIRSMRSGEVVERIAKLLEEEPFFGKLTNADFADLLNARGIKTGWERLWTAEAVRRQRKEAQLLVDEQLALEAELDAEEAATTISQKSPSDIPGFGRF